MRLSSVTGTGFATRGACRSIDASSALEARRVSRAGGVASALVGRNPRSATASPMPKITSNVTITPAMNAFISLLQAPQTNRGISTKSVTGLVSLEPACLFDNVSHLRQETFLLRRRERHRSIQGSNAHDGPIQIVEGV